MTGTAPVRVSGETHAKLTQLRLDVASDIGRPISMGEMISILIELARAHKQELRVIGLTGHTPDEN